jgi:hypothetical protein
MACSESWGWALVYSSTKLAKMDYMGKTGSAFLADVGINAIKHP